MPTTLNFVSKYAVNDGLVISATELLDRHLFGIPMCTQNGVQFQTSDMSTMIRSAQTFLEQSLDIKFKKQVYHERCDFVFDQFKEWGFVKTTLPVRKIHKLVGQFNSAAQIEYPPEWSSVYMNENDDTRLYRNTYIVPNGSTTGLSAAGTAFLGISPAMGFFTSHYVPNYWDVTYCTGFDKVPENIIEFVAKLTTMKVLNILGDVLYTPGIASQSLGFDGLSQSISTTLSSGNLFKGRITQYQTELQAELKSLREYYKGISYQAM